MRLRDNGYIFQGTASSYSIPEAERFLPDRYVEGTCPHCGYGAARGDQCDNCGRQLDPMDLINPRSRMTGATPVPTEPRTISSLLTKFEGELLDWLQPAGMAQARPQHGDRIHRGGTSGSGDHPRPHLGRPHPSGVRQHREGKRIYVWFDAVIGYLSAAKEWAQLRGTPEAWRDWWENPRPRATTSSERTTSCSTP